MTPGEVQLWSNMTVTVCTQNDYVMHNVVSLACGLQDVLTKLDKMVGETAYEHHMKASVLSREGNEVSSAINLPHERA
jgi:phosphopantetheine adenylyltransferase